MKKRVKKGFSNPGRGELETDFPPIPKKKVIARRREKLKINKLRDYDFEDIEEKYDKD